MNDRRRAIVLVPGLGATQVGSQLTALIKGLESAESVRCSAPSPAEIQGLKGTRLECTCPGTVGKQSVDVFECFYNDLVPLLSQQRPWEKLWGGTRVLAFWFWSGAWRGLRHNTYVALSAFVSTLILLIWYFFVLGIALKALGEFHPPEGSALIATVVGFSKSVGNVFESWSTWIGLTTVLGLLQADKLADIGHFVRLYLASGDVRAPLRARVREPLFQVLESGEYDDVIVLAHSFGTVIATDVLGDVQRPTNVRLGVVTLGSAIGILKTMSPWMKNELVRCGQNGSIDYWIDFNSPSDWMAVPVQFDERPKFPLQSRSLDDLGNLLDQLNGAAHSAYFSHSEVLKRLLNQDETDTKPSQQAA